MTDVAIIGGGPAGCVAALAFAHRGAQVCLLDGQPDAARRLAGEWLHPAGVEVLRRLGVELPGDGAVTPGQGFVVFPEDGSAPMVLRYPDGSAGLSCQHFALVGALRRAAIAHPNVRWLDATRATGIAGQRLRYLTSGKSAGDVTASLIVGADGRSSFARTCLGLANERSLISSMAGVLLEDTALPFEGFGHVLLGGPAPMLTYRVGPRHVRLLLDVPAHGGHEARDAATLERAYAPALPAELAAAFRQALQDRPIDWASNQWRPRGHYGREGLALVGDAVGHFHPLTAVGMTLGFLDAVCLAEGPNVASYRRDRHAHSRTPELLATALYNVFSQTDDTTTALRGAVYALWRQDAGECDRTMRLLSAEETDLALFRQAFLKVLSLAGQRVAVDLLGNRQWRRTVGTLGGIHKWLFWLAGSLSLRRALALGS